MLHFLWDQAELTHWSPGFAGKRKWAVVRSHLLRAAENKMARGSPLLRSLFIPEVFSVDRRDEINARRTARLLHGTSGAAVTARPLLLLIAELKEIVPARFRFKAVIKHVPDQAFALDRQLRRRMSSRFASELSLWTACDSIHMMLIAAFGIDGTGVPALEELALMPVNSEWIPVDDVYDEQLVDGLVSNSRAFVKLLRYDTHLNSGPAAVLLDAGDSAPHLRVKRSGDEDGEVLSTLLSTDAADRSSGCETSNTKPFHHFPRNDRPRRERLC